MCKKMVRGFCVDLLVVLLFATGMVSACGQTSSNSSTTTSHNDLHVATKTVGTVRLSATKSAGDELHRGAQAQSVQGSQASAAPLLSLRMLDVHNGWALTNTTVVRTVDGGLHWRNVSPGPGLINEMSSGEFRDALHAWIAAPIIYNGTAIAHGSVRILRTVDGGAH